MQQHRASILCPITVLKLESVDKPDFVRRNDCNTTAQSPSLPRICSQHPKLSGIKLHAGFS